MINRKSKDFKIGWGEVIIIFAFIILAVWGHLQKMALNENARYTKGVITGSHKGAKGSTYIDFEFFAGNDKVNSWTPVFNGWRIGDTILIKYNQNDPNNNNVIKNIPDGEHVE
ncbi:MAG: hypothetical protein ACK5CC_01615 [Bacteroidota bacterium]